MIRAVVQVTPGGTLGDQDGSVGKHGLRVEDREGQHPPIFQRFDLRPEKRRRPVVMASTFSGEILPFQTLARGVQEMLILLVEEDLRAYLSSTEDVVGHESASCVVEGSVFQCQVLHRSRCGCLIGVFDDDFVDRQAHTAQLRPECDFAESQDFGGPLAVAADFLQDPEDDQAVQLFP